MLNQTQKNKIRGFISDEMMSDAVRVVLEGTFKKKRNDDVGTLAAQMMALNLLEEGFKELSRYLNETAKEKKSVDNPGL